MYKTHPALIQPDDENVKIWRYMDFTKFVSLITDSKLFFARADRLDDPFEGSWPKKNIEARKSIFRNLPEADQDVRLCNLSNFMKIFQKNYAMNCWHENEYESAAMWKLYLKSNEGIAIQSTYRQLKKSIIDEETVFIGKVKYIDFENEFINPKFIFAPLLYKRRCFEHEKEIRAIVIRVPPSIEEDPPSDWETFDLTVDVISDGIPLKIDIESLIQKIYVAPNSPLWYFNLVKKVLYKYSYNFEVIRSEMDSNPLF